jgi:uncharacterized membrane protein
MENTNTNPIIKSNNFDINEVINHGWELFKKDWDTFFVLMLATGVVTWAISGAIFAMQYGYSIVDETGKTIGTNMPWELSIVVGLLYVISYYFSIIFAYNTQKIYLEAVDGKEIHVKEAFNKPTVNTLMWIGTGILYGLVVFLGFILLIVPGIYLALRYQYAAILVLDKGMRIKDAFATSAKMTDGIKWNLIGYGLSWAGLIIVAVIVGLICLIIGVIPAIFAVSVTMQLSSTYLYKKLSANI